jgi:hypothetical protein
MATTSTKPTLAVRRKLPVFVLEPASDLTLELNLPPKVSNLFQRLIRNPHVESEQAKERECAEMLCVVLQNAPTLRRYLLGWMAGFVGLDAKCLDNLDLEIDTEQAIGSKRDDLRLVGRRGHDADGIPALIWTIEVKVGASFHDSSLQVDGDANADTPPFPDDQQLVNQLLNYDHWLNKQAAEHKAGFVLALKNCRDQMPGTLTCEWACLSWTQLGELIAEALRTRELTEPEELLARHALGFIKGNLWRTSEMSDARLDYNDVSLIRAYAQLAKECESKVNRLVEPLLELIEKSGIGKGEVTHTQSLFRGQMCSYAERDTDNQSWVYAGIGGDPESGDDYLMVGIESARSNPQKPAFKTYLKSVAAKLQQRNWNLPSQESDGEWMDLSRVTPLASLLIVEDQQKAVTDFVRTALADLKEFGVVDAFNKTVGGSAAGKRK